MVNKAIRHSENDHSLPRLHPRKSHSLFAAIHEKHGLLSIDRIYPVPPTYPITIDILNEKS